MTTRDKLIDILIKTHGECVHLEQEQPYPCEGCKYRTLDRRIRGCIFDRYADAIIESGLVQKDTQKLVCPKCKGNVEVLSCPIMGRDFLCVKCGQLYYYEDESIREQQQ